MPPRKRLSDYEGSRRLIPEFPVETSLLLSLCQCKSQFQSANPSRWSTPSAGTPPVSGRLAASLLWFSAGELLSEDRPDFNIFLDPKCDWALRHLEAFPVEINRADYNTLLRVPGIGVKSANRIVKARRHSRLDFSDLKKIGVVLKRAAYFITCSGRMMYSIPQMKIISAAV